jgi:hypothetical protein
MKERSFAGCFFGYISQLVYFSLSLSPFILYWKASGVRRRYTTLFALYLGYLQLTPLEGCDVSEYCEYLETSTSFHVETVTHSGSGFFEVQMVS